MSTITQYFEQAKLSLAAYAKNLQPGMSGTSIDVKIYIASLEDAGRVKGARLEIVLALPPHWLQTSLYPPLLPHINS